MWVTVDEKVHHLDAHMAPQADPHHTRECLRRYFSQMLGGAEPEEESVAVNEEADDATATEACNFV